MATNKVVTCNALTGGAAGALDEVDGAILSSGDRAVVITDGVAYEYRLKESGSSESSPTIISPDSNAGSKRWHLQGYRMASLQLASGGTPTEFSTDGTFAGNSDTAVPTEKAVKTYVDSVGALSSSSVPAYTERAWFSYKDTDEIYIYPGAYNHNGTSEQIVYWDSVLTYQFTGLSANTSYYLYLDDSAIVSLGTNLLTASEFTHSSTAGTFSQSKHGYYNGSDKQVFAIITDSSGNIRPFVHDGGRYVKIVDSVEVDSGTTLTTSTSTITLTGMPNFGEDTLYSLVFNQTYDSSGAIAYAKKNGLTGTGTIVGRATSSSYQSIVCAPIHVNSSLEMKVSASSSGTTMTNIWLDGFYLPKGM